MKRKLASLVILALGCLLVSTLAVAEPMVYGFGYGGAMAMAFFPDMTGINTFMSENGLPSMGDVLIGAGGNGRGGIVGGPVFGGGGWGLLAFSENDELSAELVSAGGGFDMGRAIGGNERSVLSVGALLGGGANVLSIDGYLVQTIAPEGLVPEPTYREIGTAMAFVQPYVSMAARLLPWMGFEFRVGYILPLFEIPFGDLLGIPAPSMSLSGPTVSFGLSFGGIGSVQPSDAADGRDSGKRVTVPSEGSFEIDSTSELTIENAVGNIVISSYVPDSAQTISSRVEWQAARTAKQQQIDALQVLVDVGDTGTSLRTEGAGRIDYVLRIPQGIDLRIQNGVGNVTIVGHEALTIIVENGVGEIAFEEITASALIIASGIGEIGLSGVAAESLIVEAGLGEIRLSLPLSASARIMARAGIGDVDIDRFPGMIGGVRGFLGSSGDVTLGLGEDMIELNVGIGSISIEIDSP